jgi:hypothetical protein
MENIGNNFTLRKMIHSQFEELFGGDVMSVLTFKDKMMMFLSFALVVFPLALIFSIGFTVLYVNDLTIVSLIGEVIVFEFLFLCLLAIVCR